MNVNSPMARPPAALTTPTPKCLFRWTCRPLGRFQPMGKKVTREVNRPWNYTGRRLCNE
jgi:hypothetical protein